MGSELILNLEQISKKADNSNTQLLINIRCPKLNKKKDFGINKLNLRKRCIKIRNKTKGKRSLVGSRQFNH